MQNTVRLTQQIEHAANLLRQKNAEIATLNRTIRNFQKAEALAEKERAKEARLNSLEIKPPKWTYTPTKNNNIVGCPITVWGDFHYGEVVTPNEIGGVNKFNTRIAEQRIKLLANKVVDLSFNHMGRGKNSYEGIVVCLAGDMIGGEHHDELIATNERSNLECVHELAEYLVAALHVLASKFSRVHIVGVVGNHGRIHNKVRFKQRVKNNYDWALYKLIQVHLQSDKRFTFYIPEEADAPFRVHGHRFFLTHGDALGTRGGDGLIGAIGPIARGRLKVGALEAQIGRDFDTLIVGHWHYPFCLPGIIANGTLKGYDEYARLQLRAPFSLAQQYLFFVHPKYGITVPWPVFLQEPLTTQKGEWVSIWQNNT